VVKQCPFAAQEKTIVSNSLVLRPRSFPTRCLNIICAYAVRHKVNSTQLRRARFSVLSQPPCSTVEATVATRPPCHFGHPPFCLDNEQFTPRTFKTTPQRSKYHDDHHGPREMSRDLVSWYDSKRREGRRSASAATEKSGSVRRRRRVTRDGRQESLEERRSVIQKEGYLKTFKQAVSSIFSSSAYFKCVPYSARCTMRFRCR
jgi:hypothetical protein